MTDAAVVALNATGLIGSVLYRRLVTAFGSAEAALSASTSELTRIQGIGKVTATAVARVAKERTGERELELAAEYDTTILTEEDPGYPSLLKSAYDHPIVLYVRGALRPEDRLAVGIVGTRKPTPYGKRQAALFAEAFGRLRITVVSGLARGVDAEAHKGAMKARDGRTLAVMGSGLRRVYPPEHRALYMQIAERGAVVSEFPMDVGPEPTHFPRRNRIISGLSLGTLVVEASIKSGALITADWALEQNREVFAIPGPIDGAESRGVHHLIKQGAKLVETVEDILMELPAFAGVLATLNRPPRLSPLEQTLLGHLGSDPITEEEIVEKTRLPASAVTRALVGLKSHGLVKSRGGGFVKAEEVRSE